MLANNATPDKINFNTDRLIITAFPAYAGGKFLINCLGLSDFAIMQHQELAEQQLIEGLPSDKTSDKKLKFLLDNLHTLDFGTGCVQLFGVDYDNYRRRGSPESWNWSPVISPLSNGQHWFFLVAHNEEWFELFKRVWPRAKTLVLKNSSRLISRRIGNNHLENVRRFDSYWDRYPHWTWNTDWYFNHDDTIKGLAQLYHSLQMPDFNADKCSRFYHAWFDNLKLLP